MKKNVIFIACIILSIMVLGQNETKNQVVNEKKVEGTTPKFVGIKDATAFFNVDNSLLINNYISENVVCPRETANCEKEGTEVVQFTVTPSGNLTDFKVINSVCPEMDKEFIRVLKTTNGMWKPGYNNGEPVEMEHDVAMMIGDCGENKIVNHFVQHAEKWFEMGNKTLLEKHNPKKALKFYDKGVLYLPNDKSLLTVRGICHYELGDTESAKRDWNRVVKLGGINPGETTSMDINDNDFVEMKGYSAMTSILNRNKN
jgi:hypothetical protein